eukprot:11919646-Alexandrium_andersonii.AAC.1
MCIRDRPRTRTIGENSPWPSRRPSTPSAVNRPPNMPCSAVIISAAGISPAVSTSHCVPWPASGR